MYGLTFNKKSAEGLLLLLSHRPNKKDVRLLRRHVSLFQHMDVLMHALQTQADEYQDYLVQKQLSKVQSEAFPLLHTSDIGFPWISLSIYERKGFSYQF